MAQLPPKVPSMSQNWPSFPLQMMPMANSTTTTATAATATTRPHSWVDEFLDFSAARRNSHRKSVIMSDPIAVIESQSIEQCHNSSDFERLDDEQLRSMFSDDATPPTIPSSSNPSTPSDQTGDNDEKPTPPPEDYHHQPKNETGEVVDSSCKNMEIQQHSNKSCDNSSGDVIVDPKRVKRILANRQSAQRSRVRKLQYIRELERSVFTLQTQVSALSPRVAFLDHQRLILNVDNSALKQRIAALAQDKIFKDAHQEALKKEVERLRNKYQEQTMKKMSNNATSEPPTTPSSPPPPSFNKVGLTEEKMPCKSENST